MRSYSLKTRPRIRDTIHIYSFVKTDTDLLCLHRKPEDEHEVSKDISLENWIGHGLCSTSLTSRLLVSHQHISYLVACRAAHLHALQGAQRGPAELGRPGTAVCSTQPAHTHSLLTHSLLTRSLLTRSLLTHTACHRKATGS